MKSRNPLAAMPRRRRSPSGQQPAFSQFNATQLWCPTCQQAMPVREVVALYLPKGVIYHLKCTSCGSVLGKKQDGQL